MTDRRPENEDDTIRSHDDFEQPIHEDDLEELVGQPMTVTSAGGIADSSPRSTVTDEGRFRSGRLKGLTMWSAIFVLAWPVVLESFLNSLVGLVDTKLSASLEDGVAATDAIGGASYIMWFIGLVIMAIGVGATALISRSVGKGRMGVANVMLGQATTLALIAGIGIGVFVWFGAPSIVALLNMNDAAGGYFIQYMRIIALGTPFASLLFALIACSRGAGDSISPLIAMIIRNAINIIVSWGASGVTVFGLTSPLGWDLGVRGIAIGTIVGDLFGAALIFAFALSGKWSIRLKPRNLRPHFITIYRFVRLAVPNFLETFGMWLGNFIIIAFVGLLSMQVASEGLLGAHIIGIRIEAFSFMPGFGMGVAAATLAGQYLGMNRPDLAKRAVFRCTVIASVIMGGLGLCFIIFSKAITNAMSAQPEHMDLVPPLLITCGIVQIPFAIGIVFRSAMRGAGDVKWVMGLTWFATYGIRLPLAYLISGVNIPIPEIMGGGAIVNPRLFESLFGIEPGLTALWIALCSEMFLRGVLFSFRFFHGGWLKAKV